MKPSLRRGGIFSLGRKKPSIWGAFFGGGRGWVHLLSSVFFGGGGCVVVSVEGFEFLFG